ncbi:MAG: undecaprenyl/decaprenyl-phosphate alpha-N-acetylglucosaminyl 1-phosphate transferase [Pirellulaceae bacterium]|jgi:UDP-GlcNAc:undecaprenyl-phosphate GlcNAc-1-phosphate transferase|nr:undecaprenyl/decaprenyl-phosphate alpha-N-acetylglucosaminyl 1-phosphate transferase [Pirellulaceae bacterium]
MQGSDLQWFLGGAVIPSLVLSWLAVWFIRPWAHSWGLLDRPGVRKTHRAPTPMGGGLAIWLGVIVPLAMGQGLVWLLAAGGPAADALRGLVPAFVLPHVDGLLQQASGLWVLLGGGTVLMLVGLADDRWGLSWQLRLGIQGGVAAVCVLWQGWQLTAFIDLSWITWLLSILWIVALINAFNMLDNMDGLSGGVAAIAALALAAVLLVPPAGEPRQPQLFVAGLLLVVAGALLGFLGHNRPPARIFMGDAGSYFVGFCIGVTTLLATYTEYQGARPHAVLAPLCVMAVPLYDMISVIWIRLRRGQSPFHADQNHFSHRLVELGLSRGQAVLTIYLTTATCALGALLLNRVDRVGAVLIVLMIVCILGLIAILETTARRKLHS